MLPVIDYKFYIIILLYIHYKFNMLILHIFFIIYNIILLHKNMYFIFTAQKYFY